MKPVYRILVVVAVLLALGFVASRRLGSETRAVVALKNWASTEIVPRLEEYRKKHGRYPESLMALADLRPPAEAQKMSFVYGPWPDGHYEFSFSPDTLSGFTGARWDYHSEKQSWSLDR